MLLMDKKIKLLFEAMKKPIPKNSKCAAVCAKKEKKIFLKYSMILPQNAKI
jgi:hypothetical protein